MIPSARLPSTAPASPPHSQPLRLPSFAARYFPALSRNGGFEDALVASRPIRFLSRASRGGQFRLRLRLPSRSFASASVLYARVIGRVFIFDWRVRRRGLARRCRYNRNLDTLYPRRGTPLAGCRNHDSRTSDTSRSRREWWPPCSSPPGYRRRSTRFKAVSKRTVRDNFY